MNNVNKFWPISEDWATAARSNANGNNNRKWGNTLSDFISKEVTERQGAHAQYGSKTLVHYNVHYWNIKIYSLIGDIMVLVCGQEREDSPGVTYYCARWSDRQTWSTNGCSKLHSNASHIVCKCTHLTSTIVLIVTYPVEVRGWHVHTQTHTHISAVAKYLLT